MLSWPLTILGVEYYTLIRVRPFSTYWCEMLFVWEENLEFDNWTWFPCLVWGLKQDRLAFKCNWRGNWTKLHYRLSVTCLKVHYNISLSIWPKSSIGWDVRHSPFLWFSLSSICFIAICPASIFPLVKKSCFDTSSHHFCETYRYLKHLSYKKCLLSLKNPPYSICHDFCMILFEPHFLLSI